MHVLNIQINKEETKKNFINADKHKFNKNGNDQLNKNDHNKIAEILNNFIDDYYKGKLNGNKIFI